MISISILLQKNENLFYLLLNQINIYNLSFIIMILAQRSQTLNTGILALCFMGLFTAYSSFQNIISSLYTQLGYFNLGEIILICIYVSFALGSIFCKFIIQKLGYRKIMDYSCGQVYSFRVAKILIINIVILQQSILVVFQQPFQLESVHLLFGLLNQVISLAFLINFPKKSYLLFSSPSSFQVKSSPICSQHSVQENYLLQPTSQQLVLSELSSVSVSSFFRNPNQTRINKSHNQSLQQYIKLNRAFYINCFYVFTGIGNGFYTAFLYKLINKSYNPNPDQSKADLIKDIVYHTGLVFFCLGGTQVIIGFFLNRYGSSFHYFKMCIIGVLISQMALILSLLIYFLNSYPLCFVCAALWGAADTILRTYINVFVSKEFKGVLEAFSVFRIFNSIGVCFVVVLNLSLRQTNADEYIIILILLAFQIFAIFCGLNLQSTTSGTIYSNNPESKTDLRDQLLDD